MKIRVKDKFTSEWRRWFVWHPVTFYEGEYRVWMWGGFIWRRYKESFDPEGDGWWEYQTTQPS